jgi:hypothetical protein
MPPAEEFNVDFLNTFFDPQRPEYDRDRYLAALSDEDVDNHPLAVRIDEIGLLDGQPAEVRDPLIGWFGIWPRSSAVGLIRLLREAVGSENQPPRKVLFVYHATDGPPEVERTDFPTDPFVIIVRGVHP